MNIQKFRVRFVGPMLSLAVAKLLEGPEWTTFDDSKQRKEVGNCIFERAIQGQYPAVHLLASNTRFIVGADPEVAMEQIDHRQKCRPLAVRMGPEGSRCGVYAASSRRLTAQLSRMFDDGASMNRVSKRKFGSFSAALTASALPE